LMGMLSRYKKWYDTVWGNYELIRKSFKKV
jgi:hypothetical protein